MDPNTVVLEISSDEDVSWNHHDGSGIADGSDDHNWLSELLDEVNKENYGDDSDEVVLVSEVFQSKKTKLNSLVIDLDDDCVVLDNDPDKPVEVRNDNPSNGDDDSDDILLVSEKGQVACRDYPHPRHLCVKFPFSTTPNQSHCDQCYCYVCDSLAPCVYWGNGSASTDHCHATDKDELWTLKRKNAKNVNKGIQPVPKIADPYLPNQLAPTDHYRPAPAPVQTHGQVPRPSLTHARYPSANFRPPNIINRNRTPVFASRNKFHPDLVSQLLVRTNGARGHQNHNHNQGTQFHRPVFKRPGSVGVAPAPNLHPYGLYKGNFGNPSRQQNHQNVGYIQPNAVNPSGSCPPQSQPYGSCPPQIQTYGSCPPQSQTYGSCSPQSQTYTSSTVNPILDHPLPPQSQLCSNPNFQSVVNSNPFPENPIYQSHLVPPSSGPQLASQPSYMVPAQPSYPVPSQSRVDSPSIPVSDYTHQGNQARGLIIDPGFKDYGFSWPPSQHSATVEGAGSTIESSMSAGSGGLADYRFDWIFDNQPIEPGFIEVPGPYGLSELSSDSAFLDTGPTFEF